MAATALPAIIVPVSIVAYLLIGILILRPSLRLLYDVAHNHLKNGYYASQIRKAKEPNAILIYVTCWYGCIVLVWPLAIWAVLVWSVVRSNTPQYTEHLAAIERDRLAAELKAANKVIADFDKRK